MNRREFIDKLFEKAAACGIQECEAFFSSGESFEVDVLDGAIKEYSVSDSSGVCFRGLYNGRMGYASTQIEDEEAIEMLTEGVKNNASLLETDDGESIFEGSAAYPQVNTYDEAVTQIPASEKIALSLELEKLVKSLDARVQRVEGCGVNSFCGETRIVNSKGLDVSCKRANYTAGVAPVVSENGKVNFSFAHKFARHPGDIDIREVAEKSVKRALDGLNARTIPSGQYKCILRNDMAGALLATFAGVFSGESARKGMSLLKGREGEIIASECVTLTDDPLLDGAPASAPFDSEGVACFTKDIIKNGKFITLLHNRVTAKEAGTVTTANASKGGLAGKVSVAPSNLFINASDKTPDDLYAEAGDGLLITSLMGMHSGANPISGDFSLGAKGFRIEDGKIAYPVEQITVAGNFFEILKNVRTVANDLELDRAIASPSLYIGEISVAGK